MQRNTIEQLSDRDPGGLEGFLFYRQGAYSKVRGVVVIALIMLMMLVVAVGVAVYMYDSTVFGAWMTYAATQSGYAWLMI